MVSHRHESNPHRGPAAPSGRTIEPLTAALLLLCVGLIAAIAFVSIPSSTNKTANDLATLTPTEEAPSPSNANKDATTAATDAKPAATGTTAAVSASAGFDQLKGRWLRPDGNYVLDVKSVDAGGKMDASYLNPQPIHVAKAEASRDGSAVKVFVELRDANYPGCTYTLSYNAADDQLQGVYYQASLHQSYDVVFVRLKPGQ